MNDSDFLKLLAAATVVAKPYTADAATVEDLDTPFVSVGVDSLDMLMISIYMTDVFGVPEDIAKTMQVNTAREMREFLLAHATIEVSDVDSAIANLK